MDDIYLEESKERTNVKQLTDYFYLEGTFPKIVKPKKSANLDEVSHLLTTNRDKLHNLVLENGAVLFRDFPVANADDFAQFIESLNFGQFVNYIGGDSPRDRVKNKVYTSTEAPPSVHLALHQELSYIKSFPKNIYFFCETPATEGGATIIADARKVTSALNQELMTRFIDKKITYISRYYHKGRIMQTLNKLVRSHKSWIEVFETEDKSQVEKICQVNDIKLKWLAGDWVELKHTLPAVVQHPLTQETLWFNQAHLFDFNPKLLGWLKYIGASLFYMIPSTRLHDVHFADGTTIARKDLYHILDVLEAHTVAFPWHKGDVMVLDNILAMHGRAPFKGKRRVLTALTI